MQDILLEEIADEYLVPFFSGSFLSTRRASTADDKLVELVDENRIAFKVSRRDDYRLILYRRQPFSTEKDVVPETAVVAAFVSALAEMEDVLDGPLRRDLLSTFQRRVVARAVAAESTDEPILLSAIDQLSRWADRLYEGAPISAALGFRNKNISHDNTPTFGDFEANDFGAVLSNGHDTLLDFNFSGQFLGHAALNSDSPAPFCPFRQAPIAQWTKAYDQRVALTLNRLGEILVLRDGQLLFAKRSGRWSFFTHRPIITRMGTTIDRKIRAEIYTSCLDASFARTGACIGVVSETSLAKTRLIADEDYLADGRTSKVRVLNRIIAGRKFQSLERRVRQELLALDGATVLAQDGKVIAVGAILKISGGSSGGGRLAAAKALGRAGLGIKVSQDGGVTGFRHNRDEPAFRLM